MWLFTKYGFFSAVCARHGDRRSGQLLDSNRVMVRARVRAHLETLQSQFPDSLGRCEILETVGADYRFRIFVAKDGWADVVAALAREIDYDNFKSAVARHETRGEAAYEQALHEVWAAMHALQR